MSFFQPSGNPKETTTSTPSDADQALAKFKTMMLGKVLGSMAGNRPTFASFAAGGPATNAFPGGMEGGISDLLGAMNQPGAFTSHKTGESQLPDPSMLSDLIQLMMLGGLGNSLSGGMLGNGLSAILAPLGGMLGLGQQGSELNPNDIPSATAGQDTVSVGTGSGIVPGGGGSIDPYLQQLLQGMGGGDPGYGVLQDSGLAGWNWGA